MATAIIGAALIIVYMKRPDLEVKSFTYIILAVALVYDLTNLVLHIIDTVAFWRGQ